MRKELPSAKGASSWENSFPVGSPRELPSRKRASQWERSFLVTRERFSGKAAS